MKEVHKKSIDPAVNQILLTAYRQQTPLVWTRAEAMQPQCSFGRLAICCGDCQEGPCRVNPFSDVAQQSICGRDKQELAMGHLLRKATDGALALGKLAAESGHGLGEAWGQQLLVVDDEMLVFESAAERLQMIGRCTNTALESLRQDQVEVSGVRQPAAIGVNIGVLQTGAVNIVFHGHVNLKIVNGIKTAAQRSDIPFNMVAMCGNEGSGGFQLPVVTNYDSQETPLLTGAVDLLVLGNQCVMPSLIKLANSQDVSVARVALLKDTDDYEAAVAKAHQAFRRRETKSTVIPAVKSEAYTGYTVENSEAVFQNLAEKYAQGQLKGVIYLGGCGTIANIQDAQPVNLANALINAGYLIIAAGCAGIALAKAGMCHPSWNNNLRDVLSPEIPPVLNIGSCHDAGVFLRIAAVLRQNQVPVMAVFPEINHNKVLATAIGLAVAGINTWLGDEPIFADPVLVGWLNEKLKEQAGGHILPLMNATDFLQNLTESANGR